MDTSLHIDFIAKEHPCSSHPTSIGELWGIIRIYVIASTELIIIYKSEWNIESFAEWFIENRSALCNQECIIYDEHLDPEESIAQGIDRFQNRDFIDNQEDKEAIWFENLYDYRKIHSLRFALSGNPIPAIFIGMNHGRGEISVHDDKESWAYQFNMSEFCYNLQQSLYIFFSQWILQNSSDEKKYYSILLAYRILLDLTTVL